MADLSDLPPYVQIGGGIGAAIFTLVVATRNFVKGAKKTDTERIVLESADTSDLNLIRNLTIQLQKNFNSQENLVLNTIEINHKFEQLLNLLAKQEREKEQEEEFEKFLRKKGIEIKAHESKNE